MIRALGYLVVNILVILLLSNLLPGFEVQNWVSAFFFILILTLLNWTVIPLIKFFALPFSLVTFGLVNGLINLIAIIIAGNLVQGVSIEGGIIGSLITAIIISIGLAFGHHIVNSLTGDSQRS
jgi:putative membrane protein